MNSLSPRISIITPSLNRAKYVEVAIQSVLDQHCPNVEHIIVDGGSTDGTLEILARYPHLKILVGPDRGMYDALNKGLDLATGEIIGFLNTDDYYCKNVFISALEKFMAPGIQAVAGRAGFLEQAGEMLTNPTFELSPPDPARLIEEAITGSTIINAWFFRRSVLAEMGGFDPKYKISGDAELVLRLALKGVHYALLDTLVYIYRQHTDSLTMDLDSQKLQRIYQDHVILRNSYLGRPDLPVQVRKFMNQLCANTCMGISSYCLKEKKYLGFIGWAGKAASYSPDHYVRTMLSRLLTNRVGFHGQL